MTTAEVPPCVNHGHRVAVGIIHTDAGSETYVCDECADRFWALTEADRYAATLTYLRLIP